MFVIGTAGHVDHGKSTLVYALTGINPDRLREEQERQMTIDLGFAWLTLPSGREVSIVDVPGHEDFIRNMLAGVGGIDVALFVVAADEAVMPQTREHLAILDLLEVPHGVVALTKSDLIEDPEWLELVREEVREELRGTVLEKAPIIPLSAITGSGLGDLVAELDRVLDAAQPKRDVQRPRLPIDRAFSVAGFGTVVTGTLIDGRLAVGDEVQILPGDLRARVRGLQTHKVKVQEAGPGSRVAANLSGVGVEDLRRGQVVTRPGWLEPTTLLDARLRALVSMPWPLKHNSAVEFFTGAVRAEARVRLLDAEQLEPGQVGWVQFRLAEPIAVVRGDRYIVRLSSPSMTIGGGEIAQAHALRRYQRFRAEVVARLEALSRGTPEEVLLQLLAANQIVEARELIRRSGLQVGEAGLALQKLIEGGEVLVLASSPLDGDTVPESATPVLRPEAWRAILEQIRQALEGYHRRYPLRAGMPREELKSRLQVEASFFNALLERAALGGDLHVSPLIVRLPQHKVALSPEQQRRADAVLDAFRANPYTPPSLAQVQAELGPELTQYLLDENRLVKVSDNVLFGSETYAEMERRVVAYLREHQRITVAEVRDLFGASRKYALGFLEDLDRRHITKRLEDVRVLR
jgi:selenocysteine-specific elongation factor